MIGNKSKKGNKKKGLGKVKPSYTIKKKHKKKHKKGSKKYTKKNKRKGTFVISQPRKKQFTVHRPRLLKPRQSFKSMSFMDSSSYSNVMGNEDFKRQVKEHKNIEGRESGFNIDQDNNMIRIHQYPS